VASADVKVDMRHFDPHIAAQGSGCECSYEDYPAYAQLVRIHEAELEHLVILANHELRRTKLLFAVLGRLASYLV
jgi:hypothetical protein